MPELTLGTVIVTDRPDVVVVGATQLTALSVEAQPSSGPVTIEAEQGPIGPQGPKGDQGEKGDRGEPGTGSTVPFTFSSPAASWSLPHNLGRFPSVTTVDSAGDVLFGDVSYVNSDTIIINFSAPTSGIAYLN